MTDTKETLLLKAADLLKHQTEKTLVDLVPHSYGSKRTTQDACLLIDSLLKSIFYDSKTHDNSLNNLLFDAIGFLIFSLDENSETFNGNIDGQEFEIIYQKYFYKILNKFIKSANCLMLNTKKTQQTGVKQ